MHIAHMTMPFSLDGSAVTNVVRSLVRCHGGESTVVTSHNRNVEVLGATNIRADFTGSCPRQYFDRFEMAIDHVFGALGRDRPFTGQLPLSAVQSLRAAGAEVVFVHEGHFASSSLPLFRRWLPGVKLVLYIHTRLARSYTRRELRRLFSSLDGIVCVSEYIAESVRERLGDYAGRPPIFTLLNGVDVDRFSPPVTEPDPHQVLFVGQMIKDKGADLAVKAVTALGRGVKLRLIGSSAHGATRELSGYEAYLRHLAAGAGAEISFEAFLPNTQLPGVYRSAGIVLVPSRFQDPCPLVCLEAMACGCAVIASDRGGIPAICADAALLLEPRAGEIARALEKIIGDADTYRVLRLQARRRACELDWSKQYGKLIEFVESIHRPGSCAVTSVGWASAVPSQVNQVKLG